MAMEGHSFCLIIAFAFVGFVRGLVNYRSLIWFICVNVFVLSEASTDSQGCAAKQFSPHKSFVCVCNASYCDSLAPIVTPQPGSVLRVTSNAAEKRWFVDEFPLKTAHGVERDDESLITLTLNKNEIYQKILGFGGAFSDSAGLNIYRLSKVLQNQIMKGYFSEDGLEYNLGRVPIGGTDFSPRPYSYDDLPPNQIDPTLEHFALAEEDLMYKVPFVKEALSLSSKRGTDLKLIASPWSAPAWMKTSGSLTDGQLKTEYFSVWAAYVMKFLEEYLKHGISFFAVTSQSEPASSKYNPIYINKMAWTPEEHGAWISDSLGPQLQGSKFRNVSIFLLDDQRIFLTSWASKALEQKDVLKFVDGIGVHWYTDRFSPPTTIEEFRLHYPHLPILYTEACEGYEPFGKGVQLGWWNRAESYADNIIQNLQHWVVGWMDWNIALNLQGGPSWTESEVDSPVIIDEEKQEFYKQPMYYAMAHFSKVIPEGSVRIGHEILGDSEPQKLSVVALIRPDGSTAVIITNKDKATVTLKFEDEGKSFIMTLEESSIVSLVWKSLE